MRYGNRKNNYVILVGIASAIILVIGGLVILYFYKKNLTKTDTKIVPEQPAVFKQETPNTGPEIPEPEYN